VQFDFYCFPYEPFHAIGFSGQDSSVTEHDPGSVSCSATVDSSVSHQHSQTYSVTLMMEVVTFNQMCSLRLRICIIFVTVFCPVDPEILIFL